MGTKEFARQTFKWLYQVNADSGLSLSCIKVAVQLTAHFNESDQDGRAYPSGKYLGEAIALSERAVLRAVRRLHARGHLEIKWGAPGRGCPHQYWMRLKPALAPVLADQKTGAGDQENRR
jgi:hypothetical protein